MMTTPAIETENNLLSSINDLPIVDAFRFPTNTADESSLFTARGCERDIENLPQIAHSGYALFDRQALAGFGHDKNDSHSVGFSSDSWFCLLELHQERGREQVSRLKQLGFAGVVIHPYLQKIQTEEQIKTAIGLCTEASRQGLLILICTAYGSELLFDIQPLRIAQRIVQVVATPVILVHGGGAKVVDALLLAAAFPHVMLDMSFSLNYWKGSSVEQDFAFAIQKLGSERWLFASDAPFVSQAQAVSDHIDFFVKYRFSDKVILNVMSDNAKRLFFH